MNDFYVSMLGSLRRVCTSAKLPVERVVVGGSGILLALGLKRDSELAVWTDPLGFELIDSIYADSRKTKPGGKVLVTWIPDGQLVVSTGPWMAGGEDFSGMGESIPNRGIQHWDVFKTLRWLDALGRDSEAKLLRRWQKNAAELMGPHGTAGYLARKRYGKEA